MLAGLAKSIGELVNGGLEPDVVVFTGDIAFSGKKKEYDEASKWIDDGPQNKPANVPWWSTTRATFESY